MRIPLTICGFHLQFADSTYNCGCHLQLQIPQQLNLMIQMFYHLFVDSTNCSGFHKHCCGFRKFAYFWSDFERYNGLGICLLNPKQHRRSKKSSNVADSATNWFWPAADSAYNAENAQFGLVMIFFACLLKTFIAV